ncbi:competence protein ComK [Bacillaceae bacterium CLA-AA-H227]|uniref:Competence protein ComK n=1 Tax=Robertmurraya yapensis (ex Hitch et al 2024) TaxID=3133160 RepID=A0ACC6S5F4_9BACI
MFIEGHYMITKVFMYMIGHYDRYGNPFTQIVETGRTIFINKSPIEVLECSLRATGFTLDGAIESSKWILKMEKMVPIVANPFQEVVLFPTRSLKHEDNIWLNPYHIRRTSNINGKTLIIFSNHSSLYIPTR